VNRTKGKTRTNTSFSVQYQTLDRKIVKNKYMADQFPGLIQEL